MKSISSMLSTLVFTLSFAITAHADDSAKARFESLPESTEANLSFTTEDGNLMLGVQVTERSEYIEGKRTVICRQVGAVVPNPVFEYNCYRAGYAEFLAESNFKFLQDEALIVKSTPYGKFRDVIVREAIGAGGDTLCQSYTLSPESTDYACFKKLN